MPESRPPLDLSSMSLSDLAQALAERRLPPVDEWDPPHCGSSGMRIARDGHWFHEGNPISRPAMVRLFATVLRREADGRFLLVTPGEKLDIEVEFAPFVVTAMTSEGAGRDRRIAFELNIGDPLILGSANPIRMDNGVPLVTVRGRLEASLARPVYYELAELALAENPAQPGIWSQGAFFSLMDER